MRVCALVSLDTVCLRMCTCACERASERKSARARERERERERERLVPDRCVSMFPRRCVSVYMHVCLCLSVYVHVCMHRCHLATVLTALTVVTDNAAITGATIGTNVGAPACLSR
jgi:hypothetical protein